MTFTFHRQNYTSPFSAVSNSEEICQRSLTLECFSIYYNVWRNRYMFANSVRMEPQQHRQRYPVMYYMSNNKYKTFTRGDNTIICVCIH